VWAERDISDDLRARYPRYQVMPLDVADQGVHRAGDKKSR
jgi:hypothetical protein